MIVEQVQTSSAFLSVVIWVGALDPRTKQENNFFKATRELDLL